MKFVDIEGLCPSGTWARLYREEIPADKPFAEVEQGMEQVFSELRDKKTPVVFGDDKHSIVFTPSDFFALRIVIVGF